uniref:G-protein coupled receptors family 1 profile domain-containing protein n=1 Tax=Acrobeloides nanus TaxID=290746 RepID=A0A914EBN8_9BILA
MLTTDWVEIGAIIILLLLSLPLNGIALIRLLKIWRDGRNAVRTKQEITRTGFLWLKIHLTIIDLIVILCYCPSKLGWLISYVWKGGDFLCKGVQYSWLFCFHLMSFAVVSIALDRLRTVYRLMHIEKTGKNIGRSTNQLFLVKKLILFCYIGAALFSLPQWFVWTVEDFGSFSQCTTIWHVERTNIYLKTREHVMEFAGERLYSLIHLLTVFWIPFAILFFAYLYIVVCLYWYSLRPYTVSTGIDSTYLRTSEEDSSENHTLWQKSAPSPSIPISNIVRKSSSVHVPAWRIEMRSRMFHTSIHVIAAYLICWMPYNVLALATFLSSYLQIKISTELEVLRVCVLFNTLLNPFIYGFRKN